jgi:ribonuclease Z
MRVTFLGTAAGKPSLHRNVTGIAVELVDSDYILIDCGEATQHQIMRSRLKFARLHSIYITHLHGDHIYGLPGLLSTLNDCRESDLHIFGPRGLKKYLESLAKSITNYQLIIHEHHNEYNTLNVINIDHHKFNVECCRIFHTVECFAYSITRVRTRHKIDMALLQPILDKYADQILSSGFKTTKSIIGKLQKGVEFTFVNTHNDDKFVFKVKDYIVKEPDYRLVVALDNYRCGNIFKYFKTANTLIHESTYVILPDMTEKEKKDIYQMAIDHGHSTNQMAGGVASSLGCDKLILTHFSNRYGFDDAGKMKMEREIIEGTRESPGFMGEIIPAYDFLTIEL